MVGRRLVRLLPEEPRLPSCYIIGGPVGGQKIVDIGTGTEHQDVEPDETFSHFYEYDTEKSTPSEARYRFVRPNVVAAILKHGKKHD